MAPENSRNAPRMTSLAMIGLISTPSTRDAPNTRADARSLPPPGPMTSAVNPDGARTSGLVARLSAAGATAASPESRAPSPDLRWYASAVSSYLRYPAFERSGATRGIGVDAAESMSMNFVSGRAPEYVGLSDQSPWVRS